jgi:hypothetical protein
MFVTVKEASSRSWAIGAGLAVTHAALAGFVIFACLNSSRDAQWNLIWMPLALLDFPVSIVLYPVALALANLVASVGWHLPDPEVLIPGVIHGAFGTILYLVIPPAVSAHLRWRRIRRA